MKDNMFKCKFCNNISLEELKDFSLLTRVTSDSKPFSIGGRLFVCSSCGGVQKISDNIWLKEINEIYSHYETFSAEGFYDQLVLDVETSTLQPRCKILTKKLMEKIGKNSINSWLDYGCGRGAMLNTASEICKNLNGFDLSNCNEEYLNKINNFNTLFVSKHQLKNKKFEVISMIHSLEHFINPLSDLKFSFDILSNSGFLFIQVNDTRKNPFEILVADHLTHFEPFTLKQMVERVGFKVIKVTNDWVTKEISLIATKDKDYFENNDESCCSLSHNINKIKDQISWLSKVVEKGKNLSIKKEKFGLFGSSVASTWLAGEIGEKVKFFVDEDSLRVGKFHMNKIIKSPSDLTNDNLVYIGFIPEIAKKIYQKLHMLGCNLELPPPY